MCKKVQIKNGINSINQWTFLVAEKMLARCVSYQGSCDNINGILTRDYAEVCIKDETQLMELN